MSALSELHAEVTQARRLVETEPAPGDMPGDMRTRHQLERPSEEEELDPFAASQAEVEGVLMHTLYTLGYQGLKIEHLQEWVRRLDAFLADVRLSPRSRNPVFSRAGLIRVFGDRYQHVPALGNRNYKGEGPVVLDNPGLGVSQVQPMLEERPVILLCVCPDLSGCHRRVAADLIASQTGVNLEHLGGKPANPSP